MHPADQQVVAEALTRAARTKRIQQAVIGVVIVAILAFLTAALLAISDQGAYLKECTTPSTSTEYHACYERGQKATAEVVGQILEAQRYNANLTVCLLSFTADERTQADVERCQRTAARGVDVPIGEQP